MDFFFSLDKHRKHEWVEKTGTQTAPPYSKVEALEDKHKPLLVRINAIYGPKHRLQIIGNGQIRATTTIYLCNCPSHESINLVIL